MALWGEGLTQLSVVVLAVCCGIMLPLGQVRAQTSQQPTVVTVCEECHGLGGEGGTVEVPVLAGQRSIYLRQQLIAFRSGQRKHPEMRVVARELTDREIDQIVVYYSTLPPR